MKELVIAIDGPSGAGKSVLGERVAAALHYLYFDSGVLYRALTWLALKEGIDPNDERALVDLVSHTEIDVRPPSKRDRRQYDVLVNGADVTWQIRTPQIDKVVSVVSAHHDVRGAMLAQQRNVARRGGVVMVGRDIGTVVLPDADLKIYVDASLEVRAKRRFAERIERGDAVDYEMVLEDLRKRDFIDSHRATAPLRPAPDAHFLDSGMLTLEEEVTHVLELVAQLKERKAE